MGAYTKAFLAALTAFLGSLQVAMVDNIVSNAEWINIASVTVAAGGFVLGVPNSGFVRIAKDSSTNKVARVPETGHLLEVE